MESDAEVQIARIRHPTLQKAIEIVFKRSRCTAVLSEDEFLDFIITSCKSVLTKEEFEEFIISSANTLGYKLIRLTSPSVMGFPPKDDPDGSSQR